jgi:ABC-type dipeptide/oligopeptide/nickel transport system ATPase component
MQVVDLLRWLRSDLGVAMLFIAHDLGLVCGIADRVAILHEGGICEIGAPWSVMERPRHPYTRQLVEAARRAGLSQACRVGQMPAYERAVVLEAASGLRYGMPA